MVVSLFTNCSLLPQSLHLLSSTSSKSSIRLRLSANRICYRHLCYSSPPSSGTTVVEDQLQAQSEENEAKLKQMEGGSEDKEQERSGLGKVAGTAGVVLAVIAASVAALLSVNAILAELSDKVFDGKIRIQDFF